MAGMAGMPNPPMLPIIGAAYEVVGAAYEVIGAAYEVAGAEIEVATGAEMEPVDTGIGACIGIGIGADIIGACIGIGIGAAIGAGIGADIIGADIIGAPMVGATKLPGCAIGADMPNPENPPIAGWAYPPYPP